tara:strand:- start:7900 stop:8538 length:639 start_codon:yes stop_codon:yes gene_type:complete
MKAFFLLASISFISIIGKSQISPVTFGPQIGINHNSLSASVKEYEEIAKVGMQGGLFFRLTLGKIIIQPEAVIGVKRGELDFVYTPEGLLPGINDLSATQELAITTLDVPMMVGYQFLDIPIIKLRALAGPVASIIMNEKVSISKNEGLTDVPTTNLVELQESALWSLQAGLGVDLWKLAVDVRYNFGLSYIDASSTLKNNLFTINVGFKIL